jgi:phosphatidylserine/phosphatidylglycerophosphate/cardiolipin synthase-like enzyme
VRYIGCTISSGIMVLQYMKSSVPLLLNNAVVVPEGSRHFQLTISTGRVVRCKCKSMFARNQLMTVINRVSKESADSVALSTRFGSFHQVPENVSVDGKWFVDGASYFEELRSTLLEAKKEILITDWSFQPEVYLTRGPNSGPADRLDVILKRKAAEGVTVCILLWWEVSIAVGESVDSGYVQQTFQNVPNLTVLRHPLNNVVGKWSHHQKSVVIDRETAYVGGLDLCFGRYDTNEHTLVDENHLRMVFPGKDFYNPCVTACAPLSVPFTENLDRSKFCRMPWHDVQVGLYGYTACQFVARNFVERWNMVLVASALKEPVLAFDSRFFITGAPKTPPTGASPVHVQVVRSLSAWSGPLISTESSISAAYLHMISTSEFYVYIENQFFISSVETVQNQVANALVQRIYRAFEEDDNNFRVVINLPLHPEGAYDSQTPRIISLWTYRTIQGMLKSLHSLCQGIDVSRYLSFHCLLKHDVLNDASYLNMIYIHSKLMLVDDRFAIVGSANINDRSLLGDRDSEIAVVLESCDDFSTTVAGTPNIPCSKFVWSWRVALWREHMGFARVTEEEVADPIAGADLLRRYSQINLLLAEPAVRVEPFRIWQTITTGLPSVVEDAAVRATLEKWLSVNDVVQNDVLTVASSSAYENSSERLEALAKGERRPSLVIQCGCCKRNPNADLRNFCQQCEDFLCGDCSIRTASPVTVPFPAASARSGRRGGLGEDALKQSITGKGELGAFMCHSCAGFPSCPFVESVANESTRAVAAAQAAANLWKSSSSIVNPRSSQQKLFESQQ